MIEAFQVWTDYEACETFADISSAEAFCFNTYGPDKETWPTIHAIVLQQVLRKPPQKYHAIAWWPDWTYEKPPQKAYVKSCYGAVVSEVVANNTETELRFRACGETKEDAETAACALAENKRPRYVGGQSSNTSGGRLEIFRQAHLQRNLWTRIWGG